MEIFAVMRIIQIINAVLQLSCKGIAFCVFPVLINNLPPLIRRIGVGTQEDVSAEVEVLPPEVPFAVPYADRARFILLLRTILN